MLLDRGHSVSLGGTSLRLCEGRGFPTLATPVEDSGTCHPE